MINRLFFVVLFTNSTAFILRKLYATKRRNDGVRLLYQNTSRGMSWQHPQNSAVGMPKNQFTGKESETMEISGKIYR